MSSQKGNVKRARPQKYQNKAAFKNVYHDTSTQTQHIVSTDVTGVCARCKDCIDWKIKYKKYKPLTQPKTCASCKQKTVKLAYHVFCTPCGSASDRCAKCGDKKHIVLQPKLSEAEQASEDRELQFELEQLPERQRRTFLRLQEKGLLRGDGHSTGGGNIYQDCDDDEGNEHGCNNDDLCGTDSIDCENTRDEEKMGESVSNACAAEIDISSNQILENATTNESISNGKGEME